MVRLFGVTISETTKARDQEENVSRENLQLPRVSPRKDKSYWTKEEHTRFLEGLRCLGKGDSKGISEKFVKSKSAKQVTSHAQMYRIRQNRLNNQSNRRRRSKYDAMPIDEPQTQPQVRYNQALIAQTPGKQVQENQNANPTNSTNQLVLQQSSSTLNHSQGVPSANANPVLLKIVQPQVPRRTTSMLDFLDQANIAAASRHQFSHDGHLTNRLHHVQPQPHCTSPAHLSEEECDLELRLGPSRQKCQRK